MSNLVALSLQPSFWIVEFGAPTEHEGDVVAVNGDIYEDVPGFRSVGEAGTNGGSGIEMQFRDGPEEPKKRLTAPESLLLHAFWVRRQEFDQFNRFLSAIVVTFHFENFRG